MSVRTKPTSGGRRCDPGPGFKVLGTQWASRRGFKKTREASGDASNIY